MDVIQLPDLQPIVAEGEGVTPCNAPDPSLEAKPELTTVKPAAETEVQEVSVDTNGAAPTTTEEAEPATIEPDAAEIKPEEEMPVEEPQFAVGVVLEPVKEVHIPPASEEIPSEGDNCEEVTIIKQKRKFDAIQDEGTAAEENVSKKIKFEE